MTKTTRLVLQLIALFGGANWLTPTLCTAQEAVTCLVVVEKSCGEIFGAFPNPNSYCDDIPCETPEYCTTGEPLVVYFARGMDENDWNDIKLPTVQSPPPGGTGHWYSTQPYYACAYESVCKYECKFIVGEGNRCQVMHMTPLMPTIAKNKYGPCVSAPD